MSTLIKRFSIRSRSRSGSRKSDSITRSRKSDSRNRSRKSDSRNRSRKSGSKQKHDLSTMSFTSDTKFNIYNFLPKQKNIEINILEIGAGTGCIGIKFCKLYLKKHPYLKINYFMSDYDTKPHFLNEEIPDDLYTSNIEIIKITNVDVNNLESNEEIIKYNLIGNLDLIISINPFYYGLMKKPAKNSEGMTYWKDYEVDLNFTKQTINALKPGATCLMFAFTSIFSQFIIQNLYDLINQFFPYNKFEEMIRNNREIKILIKKIQTFALNLNKIEPRSVNRFATPLIENLKYYLDVNDNFYINLQIYNIFQDSRLICKDNRPDTFAGENRGVKPWNTMYAFTKSKKFKEIMFHFNMQNFDCIV